MKNFSFLNIGSIILTVFLTVFVTSVQESQERIIYKSLPKIKKGYSTANLGNENHRLKSTRYNIGYIGALIPEIRWDNSYARSHAYIVDIDNYEKEGLKIVVDTTQIIYKLSEGDSASKSHPVFIYNSSYKNYIVGLGTILYMHLEAKNRKGEWKPIEKQWGYFCGTGIYTHILKPNNICVSSVYKYSGNFKTKLRLKHLGNYSNEFEGYVNLDEFGEYDTKENGYRVVKNPK
ncbi:hypothetical protein [Pontimicrobium sp. MEBiC06410]